jgi:MFS family permease
MFGAIRPIVSLLAGVALVLLGAGLLNTLIPLRGHALGFSDSQLGMLTSAYFAGFLLGTFLAPAMIRRVGHIRAFALFASLCACAALLHALGDNIRLWLLLRLAIGTALVGLYTVIESWLNAQADPAHRGRLFAVYMIVNLASLALAQQLLRVGQQREFVAFVLVALLICASMLPVLWTRQAQPQLHPVPKLALVRLINSAPSAAAGAVISGLAMGAFWGLLPLYGANSGMDSGGVAAMMSSAIVGGAALQWPLGRLSDGSDRRLALALVGAAAAAIAMLEPFADVAGLSGRGVIFLFGGMAFAIYPIAVAHLIDHLPPDDVVAASSGLLLLYGLGSTVGPLVGGVTMGWFGPGALFAWFALTHAILAAIAAYRYLAFRREQTEATRFAPMLRTTPASLEMLGPAEHEHSMRHD